MHPFVKGICKISFSVRFFGSFLVKSMPSAAISTPSNRLTNRWYRVKSSDTSVIPNTPAQA